MNASEPVGDYLAGLHLPGPAEPVTYETIAAAYATIPDLPISGMKLTREQADQLRQDEPPGPAGTPGRLWPPVPTIGIPVEIVDHIEQSTPYALALAEQSRQRSITDWDEQQRRQREHARIWPTIHGMWGAL